MGKLDISSEESSEEDNESDEIYAQIFASSTCDVNRFWHRPPEILLQKHFNRSFHHEIMPQKF